MSGGFSNPIVGGGGDLVYPEIQSPNFVHGVSGWKIGKDGSAEFNSIFIPPGSGGATIFIQATAPVALHTGDLWYDSSSGMLLHQWNGAAWGPFSIGTGAIGAGAITAGLIAANTITAGQIAAGTITASQIAAGTITAAQIAANTITAGQLSAGIIYAGIVNGTTITGGTLIADGTTGGVFVYSGVPALGNLIATVVPAAGTDSHGNPYVAGSTAYNPATGTYTQILNGELVFGNPSGAITNSCVLQMSGATQVSDLGILLNGALYTTTAPGGTTLDDWNYVGGVSQPAYGAGWGNRGAPWVPLAFRKVACPPKSIQIKGWMSAATTSVQIVTLPSNCRPTNAQSLTGVHGAGGASVQYNVASSGLVSTASAAVNGDNYWIDGLISLDL
jgi:hypothetical protein